MKSAVIDGKKRSGVDMAMKSTSVSKMGGWGARTAKNTLFENVKIEFWRVGIFHTYEHPKISPTYY